jgi:hypothetical protein
MPSKFPKIRLLISFRVQIGPKHSTNLAVHLQILELFLGFIPRQLSLNWTRQIEFLQRRTFLQRWAINSICALCPLPPHCCAHGSVMFCKVPLSTSVDSRSARSFVTLDWPWVLSSDIPAHQFVVSGILSLPYGETVCYMHMELSVTTALPSDLVLGRDWLFSCRKPFRILPSTSLRGLSTLASNRQVLFFQSHMSNVLIAFLDSCSCSTANTSAMEVDTVADSIMPL